jgi:hypothetical protein
MGTNYSGAVEFQILRLDHFGGNYPSTRVTEKTGIAKLTPKD